VHQNEARISGSCLERLELPDANLPCRHACLVPERVFLYTRAPPPGGGRCPPPAGFDDTAEPCTSLCRICARRVDDATARESPADATADTSRLPQRRLAHVTARMRFVRRTLVNGLELDDDAGRVDLDAV